MLKDGARDPHTMVEPRFQRPGAQNNGSSVVQIFSLSTLNSTQMSLTLKSKSKTSPKKKKKKKSSQNSQIIYPKMRKK